MNLPLTVVPKSIIDKQQTQMLATFIFIFSRLTFAEKNCLFTEDSFLIGDKQTQNHIPSQMDPYHYSLFPQD